MGKGDKGIDDASDDGSAISKKNAPTKQVRVATTLETLSFAFETGARSKILFFFGSLGAIGNGMVSRSSLRQTAAGFPFESKLILLLIPNAAFFASSLFCTTTNQMTRCIHLFPLFLAGSSQILQWPSKDWNPSERFAFG
jgi:hypothetical protein